MQSSIPKISINDLIDLVKSGGKVRTGVDVFNKQGRMILDKNVLVDDVKPLLNVQKFGVKKIPIVISNDGGMWDKDGNHIALPTPAVKVAESKTSAPSSQAAPAKKQMPLSELDRKIDEINSLKQEASQKYNKAKDCIKEVLTRIQDTGGEFEIEPIVDTVSELFDFVTEHDNAFSYLTREIFSYDDYLYNHSINVCTIGTVIMKKFNESFSGVVNNYLNNANYNTLHDDNRLQEKSFSFFLPEEMHDISIGFFMHDIGKVMIDKMVLNKNGKLTEEEFEMVKEHSTSKGIEMLEKNKLANPYFHNISLYHHARLYRDEERCYPEQKEPHEIPAYAKVCKLADIYDAMTSKRSYKEALNPVGVVADIFHKYAEKDRLLQFILHSFVKAVGIYPPGSIISLTNGQLAYVIDSEGPTLLPITDASGQTLKKKPDMMLLDKVVSAVTGLQIDRRKPPLSPVDAYKILPDYLKKSM